MWSHLLLAFMLHIKIVSTQFCSNLVLLQIPKSKSIFSWLVYWSMFGYNFQSLQYVIYHCFERKHNQIKEMLIWCTKIGVVLYIYWQGINLIVTSFDSAYKFSMLFLVVNINQRNLNSGKTSLVFSSVLWQSKYDLCHND